MSDQQHVKPASRPGPTKRARRSPHLWSVLLPLMSLGGACSLPPAGASDAGLARAKSEATQGGSLYHQNCARCHGERGEGVGSTPAVMGAGALPEYPRSKSETAAQRSADPAELQNQYQTTPPGAPSREPFDNARAVFDYVQRWMPQGAPGSLKPDEYWAIVNFILIGHGSPVPKEGVSESNAVQVKVNVD